MDGGQVIHFALEAITRAAAKPWPAPGRIGGPAPRACSRAAESPPRTV